MSVTALIEEFLHDAFDLPVVKDLGQTKVERVISYRVAANKTVSRRESTQTLQMGVNVSLRAENGYDSSGWMFAKLSEARSEKDCELTFTSPNESVEYISPTEVIFTTSITLKCTVQMDVKKEVIKSINWSET